MKSIFPLSLAFAASGESFHTESYLDLQSRVL